MIAMHRVALVRLLVQKDTKINCQTRMLMRSFHTCAHGKFR